MRKRNSLRSRLLGATLAVALVGAVGAEAASAQATTGKCPGTFQVLHNDKIGKLNVPKGPYTIRVKNMACQDATEYFARFLQDPDGDLPRGWKLMLKKSKFKHKKGGYSFRIKPAGKGGGGGGGGGGGSAKTALCSGTFQVLHNDRIGNLAFPKGPYVIRVKGVSCQSASNYFKQFLADPDGDLPRGWKLIKNKRKFKNKPGGFYFTTRPAK